MTTAASPDPDRRQARRWFWWGCGFEASLLVVAALIGALLSHSILATFHFSWSAAAAGLVFTVPLWCFFLALLYWPGRLRSVKEFLETVLLPICRHWAPWQIALISLIAGVAEETLFRAVLQAIVADRAGPLAGLFAGAVAFGLAHWVTREYAALTFLIGLYLGVLWMWSGNLLAPIVTHALYDFLALTFLVRRMPPTETAISPP